MLKEITSTKDNKSIRSVCKSRVFVHLEKKTSSSDENCHNIIYITKYEEVLKVLVIV